MLTKMRKNPQIKMFRFVTNKGFTLIEVMIASAILVIVLAGLISTLIYCLILNDSNSNLITAVNDAQYILEQIKGLAYSEIAGYTPSQPNNLNNETVTLTKSIGIKIAEVTVDVNWTERQRARNFQLSTRIAR